MQKEADHTSVQSHLSSNKISVLNMTKTTKKKMLTALPVHRVVKKTKAESPKTSTVRTPKKAKQKGFRVVKTTKAESPKKTTNGTPKKAKQKGKGSTKAKTGKSTNARPGLQTPDRRKVKTHRPGLQTPDRKKVKTHSAHSTPSTVTSNSTSSSKRAVSMMNSLQLKSPPKKMKSEQDVANAIDFDDASTIDWLSKKGLCDALAHYGEDKSELKHMDFNAKVVLLCNNFKPNDIRPVFQGIYQEAGKNSRSLKLAKHRTMKTLAFDFAKACVDIGNARTALTVPGRITIKKENLGGSANA